MQYTQVTSNYPNFQTGQRLQLGVSYSSQDIRRQDQKIVIRTYEKNKVIETHLSLEGPEQLSFTSQSDDPRIPVIKGRFLNSEYEESHLNTTLPEQNVLITGVVTESTRQLRLSIVHLLINAQCDYPSQQLLGSDLFKI